MFHWYQPKDFLYNTALSARLPCLASHSLKKDLDQQFVVFLNLDLVRIPGTRSKQEKSKRIFPMYFLKIKYKFDKFLQNLIL